MSRRDDPALPDDNAANIGAHTDPGPANGRTSTHSGTLTWTPGSSKELQNWFVFLGLVDWLITLVAVTIGGALLERMPNYKAPIVYSAVQLGFIGVPVLFGIPFYVPGSIKIKMMVFLDIFTTAGCEYGIYEIVHAVRIASKQEQSGKTDGIETDKALLAFGIVLVIPLLLRAMLLLYSEVRGLSLRGNGFHGRHWYDWWRSSEDGVIGI